MPPHSAVPAQKSCVVLLGASARRQWNRDHVFDLPAVETIELALAIIGTTKQSTAFRAFEIREENPRVRITRNKCAVTVGTQCFRRGRRGDASSGICGRRAAARTKLDTEIIIEQLIVILPRGKNHWSPQRRCRHLGVERNSWREHRSACVSLALWRGGFSL